MKNEYIVAPAIRKNNEIRISRFCHAEMIGCDFFFKGAEQGFITNFCRFVDRKEALKIAKQNNSNFNKVCESDELYSEDLFRTEYELVKENEELKNEIEEKELEIIGKEEYIEASMREIIEQYYTANEDCIPIQKVKYKIEELEQEIKEYIETDNTCRFTRENCILTSEVSVLKELLEGNGEKQYEL